MKIYELIKILKKGAAGINNRKGFGINEIIGIAAGIIIAAVIVIPGLRVFAQTVMTKLTIWWTTISATLFA